MSTASPSASICIASRANYLPILDSTNLNERERISSGWASYFFQRVECLHDDTEDPANDNDAFRLVCSCSAYSLSRFRPIVAVFDYPSGNEVCRMDLDGLSDVQRGFVIRGLACIPSTTFFNSRVVMGTQRGSVLVSDALSGEPIDSFDYPYLLVSKILSVRSWNDCSSSSVFVSSNGPVRGETRRYDLERSSCTTGIFPVAATDLSSDCLHDILYACSGKTILGYDRHTCNEVRRIDTSHSIHSILGIPDEFSLVSGDDEGNVVVWDTRQSGARGILSRMILRKKRRRSLVRSKAIIATKRINCLARLGPKSIIAASESKGVFVWDNALLKNSEIHSILSFWLPSRPTDLCVVNGFEKSGTIFRSFVEEDEIERVEWLVSRDVEMGGEEEGRGRRVRIGGVLSGGGELMVWISVLFGGFVVCSRM